MKDYFSRILYVLSSSPGVYSSIQAAVTATIRNSLPGKEKRAFEDLKLAFNYYGPEMTYVSFTDNSLAKNSHMALSNYKRTRSALLSTPEVLRGRKM